MLAAAELPACAYPIAAPELLSRPESRHPARSALRRPGTRRPRSCRAWSRGRTVPSEVAARLGRNQHLEKHQVPAARCHHAAVHPVSYGAQGVVVEAGHLARADRAVGQHGVPALLNRGRTHGDGVEPRRAFRLQQQAIGLIEVAGRGQRVENVRSAGEAGLDVVAALTHELASRFPDSCVISTSSRPKTIANA